MFRAEDLQPVQIDGAPQITAQAPLFAGMVADAGQQARQGQITFQLFAGVAPAAFGGMAQKGARVQPQRTQRLATGRALLRAAGLHFMQCALTVHGNAHGDLGMPAGRGPRIVMPHEGGRQRIRHTARLRRAGKKKRYRARRHPSSRMPSALSASDGGPANRSP